MRTRGWSDGDVDLLRDFAASLDSETVMDGLFASRFVKSLSFCYYPIPFHELKL